MIQIATHNGAVFLGKADDMGSVQEGKLADLVLLTADPLKDIDNTRAIALVMAKNGQIIDESTLPLARRAGEAALRGALMGAGMRIFGVGSGVHGRKLAVRGAPRSPIVLDRPIRARRPASIGTSPACEDVGGEIISSIDHWGIAHIYAFSERDAFFLQGYNAARDRLWQIDLWRKRGLGLLSASLGPAYVDEDRAARLLLYRGDMTAEWAAYAPGAKDEVEAFVAGINAYVAEVAAGTKPLPVEFTITHSLPEPWAAEDVVRIRSHALVGNATAEVLRARVACAAGLLAGRCAAQAPDAAAHDSHSCRPRPLRGQRPTVLKDYVLGAEAVAFSAATAKVAALDLPAFADGLAQEGSNNWVVAPSRSATGRPLLANDPHRQLGVPALRYIVQLSAPGLSVIGAGEPALPGVSFGHNDFAAFGITIFGIDQEDLYVYALNPADPEQYRYGDGWERMTVVREQIPVKGEPPRAVELRFTRHGPVIDFDPAHRHAFALRTVWAQPGASGYFEASWFNHARTWNDFKAAHDHWGAPPLNLVWADISGAIGWAASGLTPRRPNWDGLLPVPGDGRYEWNGFLAGAELPSSKDPAKGWFATANEMDLPPGYPAEERKVSFEWGDRSRIDRIDEVLAANPHFSVADGMALQTDSHPAIARRLFALAAPLTSPDPQVAAALARLKAWDGDETLASAPAAIYEVWAVKHLGPAVVDRLAPAARPVIGTPALDAILTAAREARPRRSVPTPWRAVTP